MIKIGSLMLDKAIIQGGMGIGVSRCRLAGAVAKEGGMGVISAAQVGYDDPEFRKDPEKTNLRVLGEQIQKAKALAGGKGAIGINLMSVTQLYGDYVKKIVEAGADAIISGAGLPLDLPLFTEGSSVKIAPIVSSQKAARLLLRHWEKKFNRTADFVVMESPLSGGHQGFKKDALMDLSTATAAFDEEVVRTVQEIRDYEEKFGKKIPVFVGGGVFTEEDKKHYMQLGADGVQVATRFILTEECDASDNFKKAILEAREEDVVIIDSPVGMPARAYRNAFVERMLKTPEKVTHCYNCLKACNPATAKYCISQALINAVKGDMENGLVFCGAKVGQAKRIETVKDVIADLGF